MFNHTLCLVFINCNEAHARTLDQFLIFNESWQSFSQAVQKISKSRQKGENFNLLTLKDLNGLINEVLALDSPKEASYNWKNSQMRFK